MSLLLRIQLDAPRGFEPRLTESESVVLPLDDGAAWEGGEIERGLSAVNGGGQVPAPLPRTIKL